MKGKALNRLILQIVAYIGIALILGGVILLYVPDQVFMPPGALIGFGLAALGINIVLGGDLVIGPTPRTFSAKGQVVRGYLDVSAGPADLDINGGTKSRIASVTHGPLGKPNFVVEEGIARLRLHNNVLIPNITQWRANLASNILWDIYARSSLGELMLDLTQLRLEKVIAATSWGHLQIICPKRGYAQIDLKTTAGLIEVTIPDGVGAHVTIESGTLANIDIQNERLLAEDQQTFTSLDFETAAATVEIRIKADAGDVHIK
ncbi:MAG: hypothetical protein JXJ17_01065 [Anaerolineae bacterium]|nr:hypothetical protein [Anaerolineae bacterium]